MGSAVQKNLGKLVVLKLGPGSFQQGFAAVLQIGAEGQRPTVELPGQLPPAQDVPTLYRRWQHTYRQLRMPNRLEAQLDVATNVSWVGDCLDRAKMLCDRINAWLSQPQFQPIYTKLLEQLNPTDTIRVVLQTEDPILQRLPWHQWNFFHRYPKAELALSAPVYQQVEAPQTLSATVRILAILGDATGLDLDTDRALLQALPGVELHLLTGPARATLDQALWDPKGWDILFFAGHSNGAVEQISLNAQDTLTIPELKYALTKAVQRGLALAIFNSCDGLGLAEALADLHIPQILVMREPVPDRVAHQFLKGFLESFSRNTPLHLSVRDARERLQGIEDEFPCATWLPILCQNLAQPLPTWQSLQGVQTVQPVSGRWGAVGLSASLTAATLGFRLLGGFQGLELATYDRFVRWWPWYETPDPRLVVVKNTAEDIEQQGLDRNSEFSITDATMLAVLEKLEPLQPRMVGIDIYLDRELTLPALKDRLETTQNVVSLCKHPAAAAEMDGVAPPPGVTNNLGFSDLFEDTDGINRRMLLATDRPPESPCPTDYSFATLIAGGYLGVFDPDNNLDQRLWSTDGKLQLQHLRVPRLSSRGGGYRLPDMGGYQQLLHYRHLPDLKAIAQTYTVSELLDDDFRGEELRDRIILLGTTSLSFGGGDIEERDFWKTPYTTSARLEDMMPGVFIQAHIISQLISAVEDDRPLITTWNEWVEGGWIVLWALIGGTLGWRLKRFWLMLLTTEVGLLLLCWSLLGLTALWVPYGPAAMLLAGTAITVKRYRD